MSTAVSKLQFSLDFQPAITEQFRTFRQVIAAAVYGSRVGLSAVAAHCDLSPSALSRMLNENEDDPRHLPADLVPKIIEVTGDIRPIQWLVARFVPDEAQRQRIAVEQLNAVMPSIHAALAVLQKKPPK